MNAEQFAAALRELVRQAEAAGLALPAVVEAMEVQIEAMLELALK